jgi:hypothetical protein
MNAILHRTVAVAFVGVALTAPVAAQVRVPPRSVLGANAPGDPNLTLSIDMAEGYDQDVLSHLGGAALSVGAASGLYATLTPQIRYQSHGGHWQLGVTAGSNARYYGDLHQVIVTNHSAGVGLSAQLTRSTALSLSQSAAYAPALEYGLSGLFNAATSSVGYVTPAASNYVLDTKRSYAYATSASLTQTMTPRAALMFSSNLRYSVFTVHDPNYPDVRSRDAGGAFIYSLNRDVKLRLGYTFRQGQYVGSPRSTEHNLDIGIGYSRALSPTRRTTVAFSLGPTVAKGIVQNLSPVARRQYRLVGNATLSHQMGRSWSVEGTYRRGLGYIEGLRIPVVTGTYSATAGGFLNRRMDLSLSAGYTTGESALTGTASPFVTYSADARLRFALSSMWSAYVEYIFNDYRFSSGIQLPPGIGPGATRHGVRTGLSLRIPMGHG